MPGLPAPGHRCTHPARGRAQETAGFHLGKGQQSKGLAYTQQRVEQNILKGGKSSLQHSGREREAGAGRGRGGHHKRHRVTALPSLLHWAPSGATPPRGCPRPTTGSCPLTHSPPRRRLQDAGPARGAHLRCPGPGTPVGREGHVHKPGGNSRKSSSGKSSSACDLGAPAPEGLGEGRLHTPRAEGPQIPGR